MANRALAAKAERAARQTRELAKIEFSKPVYIARKSSVPGYDREAVRLCEPGRYVAPEGKLHRTRATKCYGNGARLAMGLKPDVYATGSVLIPKAR